MQSLPFVQTVKEFFTPLSSGSKVILGEIFLGNHSSSMQTAALLIYFLADLDETAEKTDNYARENL